MYENDFGLRFNPWFWAAFIGLAFIAYRMLQMIGMVGDTIASIPPA